MNPSTSLRVKRVLVTGASGFIGRQSLEPLLERGYDVHAVSQHSEVGVDGVTWHHADLLNSLERKKVMDEVQPTHVLHFAWIATPGIYWTSPLNADWKDATLDLLRLSQQAGVERFVGSGTCAEYDWDVGYCDEEKTPLKPTTPYGIAKAATGRAVVEANGEMSTAWGRIFFLYGPHENPKRLVSSVILSLLKGEPAKCTHGKQIRDFLHVRDVGSAFVALLESEVTGAVNIASGIPVTIREIVESIGRQIGRPELIELGTFASAGNDPAALPASADRLIKEVGWSPAFDLEGGIADTIEWWRSQ
jgi:nucleoside-diphosphate-sugar epimerase